MLADQLNCGDYEVDFDVRNYRKIGYFPQNTGDLVLRGLVDLLSIPIVVVTSGVSIIIVYCDWVFNI